VTGDAAILVDPRSVEEIKDAMQRVQENKALRETMIRKGLERSQHYTWSRCANEYRRVFENALAAAAA